ncbi:hypothetical protein PHYBLDRAFT_146222 [Phycomyces blakesleeanus NRRL 1555(-)]|uniref:Uncharacterized protein n=1 Tax=Phycomyces blakesleeanus (strain ATCC 8743b / DSM 1359 / FGSC 10004 / NBRC 33097 / NRRL 1555) TaxID=763407 RepID=A0A162U713_PHYB8|nr:hypothetical protein PHYBLDRAFT_146222 [Phycomyces blakesleeanus NRRL 1555(-)]OAD72903.1 hypothetical protein PHYBLDRAFT_146222 [Phycomyces blakesleeanus NRRL 1555(-)]|eukprot:XP_018290943.1 hypothetical protein PHYBLDRAFT_146222 [Phycomyces blakesleeanus NRRL 1555(-)]
MFSINPDLIEYLNTSDKEFQETKANRRSRKRLNLEDLSDAERKKEFRFTLPESTNLKLPLGGG